jgi:hypothetical protein
LEVKFGEVLEILLTHETHIIQRKGWLFWSFRCEYHERETWKLVYGHSALRWFKSPQITGRSRVYFSGPISQAISVG